jgi:hypothetical protein
VGKEGTMPQAADFFVSHTGRNSITGPKLNPSVPPSPGCGSSKPSNHVVLGSNMTRPVMSAHPTRREDRIQTVVSLYPRTGKGEQTGQIVPSNIASTD